MGKGDIKTRRGKIFNHSYGVKRPRKKKRKSKKKRDKIKTLLSAKRKNKITIDYTSIREATVMLQSCITPNLNFDIGWKFYYDETNNFKKFHIKNRDDFNANIENNFVLGGLCHAISSTVIDESLIFSNIPLQKTAKEVKLKHIANGDFPDMLKSTKLTIFLENIIAMPLYLHYQSLNPLYYSLVDIIDSNIDDKYIPHNRTLKATMYDVLKSNLNKTKEIIKGYGYPNISENDTKNFIHDLIDLTTKELKKSSFIGERIRLKLLLDFLRDTEDVDELVFLSEEDEYIMIKQLNELYAQNVALFINSEHIFDNETDIQDNFAKVRMTCQNKDINNFSFTDSQSSILVQASDVIIGVIGKLFSFIRSVDIMSLDEVISDMSDIQKNNLDLLLTLYNKSLEINPSFINSIESDSELVKLNKVNQIRGFA
jgi:ribosomal small subunit protein bTHX